MHSLDSRYKQSSKDLIDLIDFAAMAISQQSDQELQAIQLSSSSSLRFTDILIVGTETTLVCDTSTDVL